MRGRLHLGGEIREPDHGVPRSQNLGCSHLVASYRDLRQLASAGKEHPIEIQPRHRWYPLRRCRHAKLEQARRHFEPIDLWRHLRRRQRVGLQSRASGAATLSDLNRSTVGPAPVCELAASKLQVACCLAVVDASITSIAARRSRSFVRPNSTNYSEHSGLLCVVPERDRCRSQHRYDQSHRVHLGHLLVGRWHDEARRNRRRVRQQTVS